MKVALVCIAKDEEHYIEEWIDYQYKLGFDKVIMYENDWRCSVERDYLEKIPWDGGNGLQSSAYKNFVNNNTEYDYAAFIDCDEFITLKKHKNIKELLSEYDYPILALNWYLFGSGGKLKRESNSQLKQFKYRGANINEHVKVIVNFNRVSNVRMINPHFSTGLYSTDTDGKEFMGPHNPNGPSDIAYITHTDHRTLEDYQIKHKRGRGNAPIYKGEYSLSRWKRNVNNNNEVFDDTAYKFMYENED